MGYTLYAKAFVMENGKKVYIKTSPMVYAFSSGGTNYYTNAKSVKVKKSRVSLKVGKSYKIKASVKKLKKSRKLMSKDHAPKLRYLSTNKKIAAVTSSGKIRGISKGTCSIYVFAHNGVYKKIKVKIQ